MNIDGPVIFILIVSAVLLVMGLVFETLSMILIMTPVLLPAAMGLGFDPIWFGIYMVIMVECALITPPVGLNLYVIQSVAKVSLGEVASGVWPFLIMMLICVFVLLSGPILPCIFRLSGKRMGDRNGLANYWPKTSVTSCRVALMRCQPS